MSDSQWLDENTGYQGVPVNMTRKQCEKLINQHGLEILDFIKENFNACNISIEKGKAKTSFNSRQVFEWLGY